MTENIRLEEDSSSTPLATVQDIQNRLLRPTSLLSPSEALSSSQLKFNLKQSGSVKKKLEDYLDPVLLAAISSKSGLSKKPKIETKFKREECKGFEWPVDELKVFVEEDSMNSDNTNDLNGDFDVIGGFGDGDTEIGGSPFGRLEKSALKRFEN